MTVRLALGVLVGLTLGFACGGEGTDGPGPGGGGAALGGSPSGGSPVGGASAGSGAARSGGGSSGGSSGGAGATGGLQAGGAGATLSGGSAGAGPSGECATVSEAIPTVGIVDWSTDLVGFTEARVEFTLDDPAEGELNVASGGPIALASGRALLLGLKQERSYTYRIQLSGNGVTCTSPEDSFTTGALSGAPLFTQVVDAKAGAREDGFIIVCGYSSANAAWILDADGEVVWMAQAPAQCSRAHMDWGGESMWFLRANPSLDAMGGVERLTMDGLSREAILGLEWSHHDFVALPGGAMAFLVWTQDANESSDLALRAADGSLSSLARLDSSGFIASGNSFHANALRYYQRDDSFTVSDLSASSILKVSRQGEAQWQVGESCPDAPSASCANATVLGNHGHQLLESGKLLVFRGRMMPSAVVEYALREDGGSFSAELDWDYVSDRYSMTLGDVQRLDNGNTLITYSNQGEFREVSPAGEVVRTLSRSGQFGYASFRKTLYGPPP